MRTSSPNLAICQAIPVIALAACAQVSHLPLPPGGGGGGGLGGCVLLAWSLTCAVMFNYW